ncbi:MAG: hypothetical protein HRU15_20490 [Planctomycetes bacterium]|nr:hypothetical protein [Planctomycetota bacterium]
MIFAYLQGIQSRADKQLQGRRVWAYCLPFLLLLMYAIESLALSAQSYSLDSVIRFISDSKYYTDPLLFEVWHLWSYLLFHDDLLQIIVITVFSFPVLTYWERYFGQSYMIVAMVILAPACLAFYIVLGVSSEQPGFSLIVPALYGGLIFQDKNLYVRYVLLTLWGSRLGLRHLHCRIYVPLLCFMVLEAVRLAYVTADWWSPVVFLGSGILALCIGSSVFTVLSLVAGKSQAAIVDEGQVG